MGSLFITRDACPACGATGSREIYNRAYTSDLMRRYLERFYSPQGKYDLSKLEGGSFILARCQGCTCTFQVQVPAPALMFELYEIWLEPATIFARFEMNYPLDYYISYLAKAYRYVQLFNKKPKELSFFDFGMGWGNWLMSCKALGCQVAGCELSPERVAYAAAHGIPNIPYEKLSDHQFDFINTDQVLEHVADPLPILQKLVPQLKPNGYLRICVPNGNDIDRRLAVMDWDAPKDTENSLNAVAPLEHINCFTTQSILTMADRVGLKPVRLPDYPRLHPVRVRPQPEQRVTRILGQAARDLQEAVVSRTKDLLRPAYRRLRPPRVITPVFTPTGTDLLFQRTSDSTAAHDRP